jgi:hypothetical protein
VLRLFFVGTAAVSFVDMGGSLLLSGDVGSPEPRKVNDVQVSR